MPDFLSVQGDPLLSFEGGIDRHNPRTFLSRTLYGSYALYHAYEDAQNILLWSPTTGGKHPSTLLPDVKLDAAITWPTGNVMWFAPFTYSGLSGGVLTFTTSLLIARTDGSVWRYNAGAPGTSTLVRRGMTTTATQINHFTYDQWLGTVNQTDAPMKYGQHFAYKGQNEGRPALFPIGSKPISPMVNILYVTAGEVWAAFAGGFSFTADGSVPGGGSRVGPETLTLPSNGGAFITYTASTNGSAATFVSRDFLNAPDPYTASPQFAGTDFMLYQVFYNGVGAINILVSFITSAGNSYVFTTAINPSANWQQVRVARSTAVVTGAPNWASINQVAWSRNAAGTGNAYIDDNYFLYGNAPPAFGVAEVHRDRIVGSGVPSSSTTLSTNYWSNASQPDYYPAANFQVMSGSADSLAKTNEVTALKEYADAMVVGMPNAVLSWSIGTDGNPTKSTITTEFGIDSQRGITETPAGSLMFAWQRGIYVLRSTGRLYASGKIATYLTNMAMDDASWTIAISDEKTKTMRFWFREGLAATNTTQGFVFDFVLAQERGEPVWPARMTQMADWAVLAYVNGAREVLYSKIGDPQIYRMGAGTTEALDCRFRLPWLARNGRDRLTKWIGLIVPYGATVNVDVYVRYAQNPGEFDAATFAKVTTLAPTTGAVLDGRVLFGKTSRWVQVEFRSAAAGMEIFPPVELIPVDTKRSP